LNLGDMNEIEKESEDGCLQHPKRVYIVYPSSTSRKAFLNFIERYITKIKPIWMTENYTKENTIDEGSLCIVLCFNKSRLPDDIKGVIQFTPQRK
jgi:hypothetical protein